MKTSFGFQSQKSGLAMVEASPEGASNFSCNSFEGRDTLLASFVLDSMMMSYRTLNSSS